ncbi:MAG: response regulator, partial [Deltaproteobacteria bacterium]|nr:response regulator [Deltaproteobacteria bacterium]
MRKKILLAEDSVTIQKVFELTFANTDISVVPVDNGDDAVRLAAEISPDLVIADVTLPGKDGFEVASAVLGEISTKDMPVLILSGTQVPFDEERFRACGARGVLFKPFETMELLEKVEGILGKREEARVSAKAPEPPPPAEERWDFSDVLDEAAEASPPARAEVPSKAGEEGFAGELLNAGGKDAATAYDEFDVSVEELEESAAPPAEAALPNEAAEIDEIEEIEDIEEIAEIAEIAELPEAMETPEAPEKTEVPDLPEHLEVDEAYGETPPSAAPHREETLPEELREQFVARAETIFRDVASEAVEKVMWEMMDRLSEE